MKIDFHVHTGKSHDGFGDLSDISKWARLRGINAVVITDHNEVTLEKPVILNSVVFIPGIEIRTKIGHLLGINVLDNINGNWKRENPQDVIHKAGGLCILAHPFDIGKKTSGIVPKGLDAIEVINASAVLFSTNFKQSRKYARIFNLPETAGSDSHMPRTVGSAYVDVEGESFERALESVIKGQGRVFGKPVGLLNRLRLTAMRFRIR
jgi:predicted metal-dependent phosphoesterase TrpH